MKHIFFLLLFFYSFNLFADTQLKSNYFINSKDIFLSNIISQPKNDIKLFSIESNKHTKRIRTKKLLELLNDFGYSNLTSKHNYTQFTQRSPINTAKIRKAIQERYFEKYKKIDIQEIILSPRTYMTQMPKEYEIVLNKRAHLSNHSTLYIKTSTHKKIFFNYTIKAKVAVMRARKEIKKGEEISRLNSKNDTIILEKFRAMPLNEIKKSSLEAKHKIKVDSILTQRDVVGLFLVKRGERVNISVIDANIAVSFSAKANKNGRYGDTISFTNNYGKKIKATVVGRNRAEIR